MHLVQMILYRRYKYWLTGNDRVGYHWSGLKNSAHKFHDKERAESVGLAYSKVDFTIEKIIE